MLAIEISKEQKGVEDQKERAMGNMELEIGLNIKALRRSLLLTQAQLSEEASISVKYLVEIERGRANPTLLTLTALATALQVPLAVLLTTSIAINKSDAD